MALKTFEHVLILADDVDKTKDFYVEILGLEVGYRPDFPFKGYWLYLKDNKAACIHLAMRKQDTGQDYYIGKKKMMLNQAQEQLIMWLLMQMI